MPTSPVSHVRVLYHVGSRDEKSDHQGFAHMFEHMMFRGSAHVAPQEHMKLIGQGRRQGGVVGRCGHGHVVPGGVRVRVDEHRSHDGLA